MSALESQKSQLFAKKALLSTGWSNNVLVNLDCNGVIQEIKPEHTLDKTFSGEIIEGAVIPGMVNTHSHAFQWAMAGLAEQSGAGADSFWSWRKTMYDFVGKITPDDLFNISSALYMQMLKAGYTSVGEFHYLHHDISGQEYQNMGEMAGQLSEAASRTGIGLTLLPVLYRYSGFGEQAPTDGQKRFINNLEQYQRLLESISAITGQKMNQNFGIAPHSLRAASPNDISQAIQLLDQFDSHAPIHIHIAEQLKEVNDCIDAYGSRSVEWLIKGLDAHELCLNERWCLVHATHLNAQEVDAIAKSQAVVSICTTTEANLGDGFFPLQDYLRRHGRWGIGSDSHISLSPVEELRWLEYENRLQEQSRTVITDGEFSSNGLRLWRDAALYGAQSLARNSGVIKQGCSADFVELNPNAMVLKFKQAHQLLDSFIFNQQAEPLINSVWVAGKKRVEQGFVEDEMLIKERYFNTLEKLTG